MRPHNNADRLDVAVIPGNIVCVVGKGTLKKGDWALYLGPEATLPPHLQALAPVEGQTVIRSTKIRGEFSCGVLTSLTELPKDIVHLVTYALQGLALAASSDPSPWVDVSATLGVTRWTNPAKMDYTGGYGVDLAKKLGTRQAPYSTRECPGYSKPLAHYKSHSLQPGELVHVTEKLHGCNARYTLDEDGNLVVCSKSMRLFHEGNVWDRAAKEANIHEKLLQLQRDGYGRATLFGEVVGRKIQDLHYGHETPTFYAFDLYFNGDYAHPDHFDAVCHLLGLRCVPFVGTLAFDDYALSLANGQSLVPGANHLREGVVLRPTRSRRDVDGERVIVKVVSAAYRSRAKAYESGLDV